MIEFAAGVLEAGPNVVRLEVWQLLQYFLGGQAISQQIQNVNDTDAHAPDAGAAAALLWINRNSIHSNILHLPTLICTPNFAAGIQRLPRTHEARAGA
jgi:hypothetical protein